MGHVKREYQIAEELSGNPPKPTPVLKQDGKTIGPADAIVFNKDKDNMKKVDHYRIRFMISDFKNSSLRFVPSMADALWAHTDINKCPDSPCAISGTLWVDGMDKKGEWIDVINMDMKPEDFRFTLNFVDKGNANPAPADYVPLDPTGSNQNAGGSGSFYASSSLWTEAATGLIVGVAAVTLANNDFVPQNPLVYGIGGTFVGLLIGILWTALRK